MSEEKTVQPRFNRNSPLLRILMIGALIMLLQVPIIKISGVVSERSQTRAEAMADISGKWGGPQILIGPYLAVPYKRHWIETDPQGRKIARETLDEVAFLPDTLQIDGEVNNDIRHRGIFEVPVYRSSLRLSGRFRRPSFEGSEIKPADILWDRARLVIRISDPRAITGQPALAWNKETIQFLPGQGGLERDIEPAVHAPLKKKLLAEQFDYSVPITINGSAGMQFVPFAQHTAVRLKSDWPHPSFQGNWLPSEHSEDAKGFTAAWGISHLGRNYPQRMLGMYAYKTAITASQFGVEFMTPVDTYRVSFRLVKYELLFLSLTFVTLWLFELLSRLRVHPVQYLLVGSAMCLFYLLELSLSEQLGLAIAYLIAAGAVTGLVTAYCLSVLKSVARAGVIGSVLALLYGYLYVLLQVQDYALLIGSVGLFVTLAVVMYVTRRIDWYKDHREEPVPASV